MTQFEQCETEEDQRFDWLVYDDQDEIADVLCDEPIADDEFVLCDEPEDDISWNDDPAAQEDDDLFTFPAPDFF